MITKEDSLQALEKTHSTALQAMHREIQKLRTDLAEHIKKFDAHKEPITIPNWMRGRHNMSYEDEIEEHSTIKKEEEDESTSKNRARKAQRKE